MPRDVHRAGTLLFSTLMVIVGVAIVVRTIVAGGGALAVGLILGVLFVVTGAGRLWVTLRGA
jgi:hypothetical protein